MAKHIAGHGALGDYFNTQLKGTIKMGDTPSVARLIHGTPEDPTQPVGAANIVRIWDGRKTIFDRLTTEADKAEVFGVMEFALPMPEGFSAKNTATMIFDGGVPASAGVNEGKVLRFRFSPRDAKVWSYVIKSDFAGLNGKSRQVHRRATARRAHEQTIHRASQLVDRRSRSRRGRGRASRRKEREPWREDFLRDFAIAHGPLQDAVADRK